MDNVEKAMRRDEGDAKAEVPVETEPGFEAILKKTVKRENFGERAMTEDMFSSEYTMKRYVDDAFVPVKAEPDFERMSAQNIIEDNFEECEVTEVPKSQTNFVVKEEPIDSEETWQENIKQEPMSPLSRDTGSDGGEECAENDINAKEFFAASDRQHYMECSEVSCRVDIVSSSNQSSSGEIDAVSSQNGISKSCLCIECKIVVLTALECQNLFVVASCSTADATVSQEDAAVIHFLKCRVELKKQSMRQKECPDQSEAKSLNNYEKTHFEKKAIPSASFMSSTKDKCFKCSECGKASKIRQDLNRHMCVHTGDKLYKCFQCGKSYAQKSSLNRHMRIHSGNRPYKSSLCETSFTDSRSLNRHIHTHMGDGPHNCSECGQSFMSKRAFTRHKISHIPTKHFICRHCEEAFKYPGDLIRHFHIHT